MSNSCNDSCGISVDVILPTQITTDVTSPSFQGNANVFIPGPQGPQGPEGPVNQFKTIKVDGQSDLVPTGIESLKFIGQTGINILTDNSQNPYRSITINAAPLSGYFEAENVIGYKANLTPQGSDSYYVQFPQALTSSPKSVVCTFQNIVDDMAYYFNIGNINSTGFYINFSDTLLNNGYYLNIQIKK
jgi:hypothetical protein